MKNVNNCHSLKATRMNLMFMYKICTLIEANIRILPHTIIYKEIRLQIDAFPPLLVLLFVIMHNTPQIDLNAFIPLAN